MIKLVFLMRRKPGMERAAFHDYWLTSHAARIRRHGEKLHIRRYVQSHAIAPEMLAAFRPEWDNAEPWDGIAEVWLDSLDTLRASRGADAEIDAIQAELLEDEASFVDLARSMVIVTEEHVIIGE